MTYYLFQIIQHKTIRYPAANMPVSQISLHRLKLVRRKVLVLDLDETLIHSHHDGKQMLMLASLCPPAPRLMVTAVSSGAAARGCW